MRKRVLIIEDDGEFRRGSVDETDITPDSDPTPACALDLSSRIDEDDQSVSPKGKVEPLILRRYPRPEPRSLAGRLFGRILLYALVLLIMLSVLAVIVFWVIVIVGLFSR
jgi:hypothetical protein